MIHMKDYNFFEIYEKKKGFTIQPKSTVFACAVILLIFILVSLGLVGRNLYLSSRINSLDSETQKIKATKEYQEADRLQNSINAMQEYDKKAGIALKKFEDSSVIGSKLIMKIASVMPSNTAMLKIEMDNAIVKADFSLPDRKSGAELILALKGSELFSNVHATNIFINEGKTGYIISIECDMKAGDNK